MSDITRTAIIHRVGARKDYDFDWTDYLAPYGDTIASASVTVTPDNTASGGLQQDGALVMSPTIAPTKVKVWLKNGLAGCDYLVKCSIQTTTNTIKDTIDFICQVRP